MEVKMLAVLIQVKQELIHDYDLSAKYEPAIIR